MFSAVDRRRIAIREKPLQGYGRRIRRADEGDAFSDRGEGNLHHRLFSWCAKRAPFGGADVSEHPVRASKPGERKVRVIA